MVEQTQPKQVNKVTYTALIISPPQDQQEQIQKIREQHDNAFDRWMPHVNVSFPFIHPDDFDSFVEFMTPQLSEIQPFTVSMKNLKFFDHGKNCVLWVDPETENENIQKIHQKIVLNYPDLNDLQKKGNGEYHPHLTLGTFKSQQIQQKQKQFQTDWKPFTFVCDSLNLIHRDGQKAYFKVIKTLKLGQK